MKSAGLALAAVLGASSTLVGLVGLAAHGVLPNMVASVVLPVVFVLMLVALHALVPASDGRSILRRAGFWLLASAGAIGLPSLGAAGLFDPWESHYGEVAREMLARHDAISTFWAHEGWFTSKPVLLFWMQALSLKILGLDPEPGRMLDGAFGHVAHPEWALRAPVFAASVLGLYVLYRGFSVALGRRVALFGALAVATSSLWVLLARQSTTDMPLVGFMSAAMGLLFAAMNTPAHVEVETRELRLGPLSIRVHGGHVVAAGVLAVLLPQAAYLMSRNVSFLWTAGARGFAWSADVVRLGSAGNCGLPGQVACSSVPPHLPIAPFAQGAAWIGVALATTILLADERKRARVLALGAWFFAAMATMAKGPIGLALPIGTAIVFAATGGGLRALQNLAPVRGVLLAAALVSPWYAATYVRHGRLFFDELVLRHMLGRTLEHLHDTNAGDDVSFRYYVAQLALALLPWTGLALLGVARALREGSSRAERFLVSWALLAYALVTLMRTKFHHYAFPALPPLAMLAGLTLARPRGAPAALATFAATIAGASGLALVASRDGAAKLVHLFTYQYSRAWPAGVDLRAGLALLVVVAIAAPLLAVWRRRARMAVIALAAAAALFTANVVFAAAARHGGQRAVMDAWMAHRDETDAPLAAYQLNWKGENFYTGNRLALFGAGGSGNPVAFSKWASSQRARGTKTIFVATERSRIAAVRGELGGARVDVLTTERDSAQFCLLRATYP